MSDTVNEEEVRLDIALAMALANHRPTGDAVAALRRRLCGYLRAFMPGAQSYVRGLADPPVRQTAEAALAEASKIAGRDGEGADPAASLRLLAKAVDVLHGYTAAHLHQTGTRALYARWIAAQPQTIIVQPTSFCNLDCTYCYLPGRDHKDHMSAEVAAAIARSAAELTRGSPERRLDLVWHAGEPLALGMRRFTDLMAPFEHLRQRNRLHHYVQTNATLITDAWCDFLSLHEFRVGISIDGPAALNAHRVDRKGRPAFTRITRGISRLRHAGIPFSVIAVVTAESIHQPEELLDFVAGLGCHTIGLNIEEAEGVNMTRPTPTMAQATEFWRRTIAWSRRNPGVSVRELDRLGDYLHMVRTGRQDRWAAQLIDPIPTISTSGDVVLLSPELAGTAAPHYDDFRAGNILQQPLASMLAAAHRLRYVREFLTGLEACEATCGFFDFCRGAQAGNRYFENGRLDTTETNYCRVSRQALITALSDTVREENAT